MSFNVSSLTCEYKTKILGIDIQKPRFSWTLTSNQRGIYQKAYQLTVFCKNNGDETTVWDSGKIESEQSIHIPYNGLPLKSCTRYYVKVRVWEQHNHATEWSSIEWFETAFLGDDEWKAKWITPSAEIDQLSEEAFYLRKSFASSKEVKKARVYVTAAGLYQLYFNGEPVSEDLLSPGWTSYHKRLQYQTYDITEMCNEGENALGIILADGWYKGDLTWLDKRHLYGECRALLLQLHVEYTDGTFEIIRSDEDWKAATGPILYSEIYHGEEYDARLDLNGWTEAGFDDKNWVGVSSVDLPYHHLIAQENNVTRVTERIRPVRSFIAPNGDHLIDMGQNIVGRIRFKVKAPSGTKITIKHAEVLDKEGNIYLGNLRTAKQTVTYHTKGEGVEEYAPLFTFQGFRYIKVEGYPTSNKCLPVDHFTGEVIHTDMEMSGFFETSDPLINQLQENIVWGQRGNFVDVPTDCPQRDERLGWTGDAQVFIRTALFNYQGGPFFTKWLRDLKADQLPDGSVPHVIPDVLQDGDCSSAWGDAAVICPWQLYLINGDERLLSEQYESMKNWVDYIRKQGKDEYLWNTGFHFGDWLGLDAKENSYVGATAKDLIATAFYAYSTRLVRDAAIVLNNIKDAREYSDLLTNIIHHFHREFISPNGRITSQTQTAYALALTFNLVEGKEKERAAKELNDLVLENDYHITTGFVGTPYISFALSENGYHNTALKLLLQETYPSWLYSIKKGATTIWEHWDSIKEDGSFWSDDMNSFNHYAYGAIGDWMYRTLAGIDMDETEPAYKKIRIRPLIGQNNIKYVKASYESMYGEIASCWQVEEDHVTVHINVPVNTTAEVVLPGPSIEDVMESGIPLKEVLGVLSYQNEGDNVRLTIASGSYEFSYINKALTNQGYSADTALVDLLMDNESRKVLEKYVPEIKNPNPASNIKILSLAEYALDEKTPVKSEEIDKILAELNANV